MRKLPYIRKTLLRNGIRPLRNINLVKVRDLHPDGRMHIVGFDTETILDYSNANMIYSTQIFYKPDYYSNTRCDIHIKPIRGVDRLKDFPKKALVFAHNLEFDLTNILGEDLKQFNRRKDVKDWKGFFVFGQASSLARFTNYKEGYDLKFIDTQNYYGGSLKAVAKRELPLQKLDKPPYLGLREPVGEEEKHYFVKYAARDAELCYLLGINIYNNYFKKCGGIAYTKAGLAVKSFRNMFLLKPFYLPDKIDMQFIWNTYNGARFESYGRGYFGKKSGELDGSSGKGGSVKIFDINSLYPYAATFPMPFTSNKLTHLTLEEYEKNKDNFIGWCKISGKYKTYTDYPMIPVRTDKLFFPLEFSNTYLTTYELEPALNDIQIDKAEIRGFFPNKADMEHPIKNYVDYYYEQKKVLDEKKESGEKLTDSEKSSRDFYKAMMNHLYGKTGEKHQVITRKGWKMLLSGKFFNPFVCSLITGKSRAVLGEYVRKYSALYADTDSVATTKTIPTSSALGGFKLEAEGDMLLIRPKLYFVLKNAEVIKLAHHSFRIKFNEEQTKQKSYGKLLYEYLNKFSKRRTIPYNIDKISRFKESVKRDLNFLTNMNVNIVVNLREDNRRHYLKKLSTIDEMKKSNTLSIPVKTAF